MEIWPRANNNTFEQTDEGKTHTGASELKWANETTDRFTNSSVRYHKFSTQSLDAWAN